jgi:putative hydrolase of the HAD superfamily
LIKAVIFDLGNTLILEGKKQGIIEKVPYASEVLTQLKNKYKLAVITNVMPSTTVETINEILKEAKIYDFFDAVVVSSEVGCGKPAEGIFRTTLEKLNVEPEEAIVIGNTISTDIFGGNRMGMRTVLLQLGQEYQSSDWEKPDHVIHSLKELLNLLE